MQNQNFENQHNMGEAQVFNAEWDDEGVWVYQAYCNEIADWAVAHQTLGGPHFNPRRMTWIKPSFGWVLYRSGYARKHNQERVLKIKISHEALAELLKHCKCGKGGGGSLGKVQWDPERDVLFPDGKLPRRMMRQKAIQIGLSRHLSENYVSSILRIEDITELCHQVQHAHREMSVTKDRDMREKLMATLQVELPIERPYMPMLDTESLRKLALIPGDVANLLDRRVRNS